MNDDHEFSRLIRLHILKNTSLIASMNIKCETARTCTYSE
jgi:hypothetical protein